MFYEWWVGIADCGGGVVEHELLEAGLPPNTKVTQCLRTEEDLVRLHTAASRAQEVVTDWAKRPASQVSPWKAFVILANSQIKHLACIIFSTVLDNTPQQVL